MPSANLLQLMGIPVPPPMTTITSNLEDDDDDTISILPSQSYDNVIIDLSRASFHEIESRLNNCVRDSGDNSTFAADDTTAAAAGVTAIVEEDGDEDEGTHMSNDIQLDERDLGPLLESMLCGKNDDYDKGTMRQSISIYRNILKPSYFYGGCNNSGAATAGTIADGSIGGITTNTNASTRISIHEGTLIYAVRKKYTDTYMMELMNLLLDAIEDSNKNANAEVDGRRILGLALIYGNLGASRVIIERYPEALVTRDFLRGQIPLHVACHVGMMVEDDDDDYYDEDGFSISTSATGRSSIIRRKRRKHRQAELIELLINEGIKYNVGGAFGAGGLYDQDNSGSTPLMQLIHALNNPFRWDDNEDDEFGINKRTQVKTNLAIRNNITSGAKKRPLANLDICIRAAWNSRGPNNHFPILHEAMNISSPDAFYRILDMVKYYDNDLSGIDQRGRTALVKAIYIDRILQRRTSTGDIIKMILGGVSSACATLRDGAGRLPLHIAAEMGLLWNDGLSDIINSHPQGLDEPHPVSGVYPFILAAQTGPGNTDLDTLYSLVRKRPKLIVRKKRDKGRSRGMNTNHFFVDFNEQKQRLLNPSQRPLTPSVHRPLVHVSSFFNESGSEKTTLTINSSSTVTASGIGNNERVRFSNKETSTNPFD